MLEILDSLLYRRSPPNYLSLPSTRSYGPTRTTKDVGWLQAGGLQLAREFVSKVKQPDCRHGCIQGPGKVGQVKSQLWGSSYLG